MIHLQAVLRFQSFLSVTHRITLKDKRIYVRPHVASGLLAHKREHEDLTRQAVGLLRESRGGRLTVALGTSRFLRDWLATHIVVATRDSGDISPKKA